MGVVGRRERDVRNELAKDGVREGRERGWEDVQVVEVRWDRAGQPYRRAAAAI